MPSARRVRWAKTRIVAVCVASGAILGTLFYLLTGGTLLQEKTTLYLFIPDGTGLSPGAPVRVDGIDVGKVRSVDLSRSNDLKRAVRVVMRVEREHLPEIPADSTAQISSDTLIGDKFVDIDSGTSLDRIRPNTEVAFKESTELMKRLDLAQFEQAVRSIDSTLSDIEQGRSRVGQFIVGEDMYADLNRKVAAAQRGLRAATDATTRIGDVIYSDRLYRRISEPLAELDRKLARLQSGQGAGGKLRRDPAQYEQFRASAADLRRSIEKFQASEFVSSDRAYTDWNRLLTSAIAGVDAFNSSRGFSSTADYDNLAGMLDELRDRARDFRRDPKRYIHRKLF